jgi:hypothetical protein
VKKKPDDAILKCDDPEQLSAENREEYLSYWASRTPGERLSEMWRITCIKYGVSPDARMDKSHFEVIDVAKYAKT